MTKLNENENKALSAICDDCDELDGYGFTRVGDALIALIGVFGDPKVAGGYITDLIKKNLIEFDLHEDEVWVNPDVFEQFC